MLEPAIFFFLGGEWLHLVVSPPTNTPNNSAFSRAPRRPSHSRASDSHEGRREDAADPRAGQRGAGACAAASGVSFAAFGLTKRFAKRRLCAVAIRSLMEQRTLCTEPNSSKFAVDAHNRAVEEIGDLTEVQSFLSPPYVGSAGWLAKANKCVFIACWRATTVAAQALLARPVVQSPDEAHEPWDGARAA